MDRKKNDKALLNVSRQSMGDTDTQSFIQHLHAFDSSGSPPSKRKKTKNGYQPTTHAFFISNMIVDLSTSANVLPTKIERELPHIMLPSGTKDSNFNPNIVGIVNTGATPMT